MDAEIDGKLSLLITVRESAKVGNWKAAAWMLERKYWREYSKRSHARVTAGEVDAVLRNLMNYILDVVPQKYHRRIDDRVHGVLRQLEEPKF